MNAITKGLTSSTSPVWFGPQAFYLLIALCILHEASLLTFMLACFNHPSKQLRPCATSFAVRAQVVALVLSRLATFHFNRSRGIVTKTKKRRAAAPVQTSSNAGVLHCRIPRKRKNQLTELP